MKTVDELSSEVPVVALCAALGVARATAYRRWAPLPNEPKVKRTRRSPQRALSDAEREAAIEVLHGPRFRDSSPAAIYATLLDEGRYLCSLRTLYRILEELGESRERREFVRHGKFEKPELLATGPNQVWSWDITKLLGPAKWTYFYLYVMLDIFSRYVVGWMVADRESGTYAKALIEESLQKQQVDPAQLTIHSDRGGPMISKPVAFLLADLGVTKSLSRPQVSNDNPFSEAQFKTLKYSPQFPDRFGSKEHAISFSSGFFRWYNQEHKHSGIGYYTPEDVHYGQAWRMRKVRASTLAAAYAAHPERFVRKPPAAQALPTAVWINPPEMARKETEQPPDKRRLIVQ